MDYIKRADAINEVLALRKFSINEEKTAYSLVYAKLRGIPTADVVEVVRCGKCKNFIPDAELDHNECPNPLEADGRCDNLQLYVDKIEFCSAGERSDT